MKKEVEINIDFIDGNNEIPLRKHFKLWYDIIHAEKEMKYSYNHNGIDYDITINGLGEVKSVVIANE